MYPYSRNSETDRERELQDQLERERDERRDEKERQYRADEKRREERQEEMRQRHESWMRSASDWPEALEKQAGLCHREYSNMIDDDFKYKFNRSAEELENDYFKLTAEANEKALEIWKEVSASKQAELEEIQKQIEAIWEKVRNEVADKLIASNGRKEYVSVAETIRDDQLSGYLDW